MMRSGHFGRSARLNRLIDLTNSPDCESPLANQPDRIRSRSNLVRVATAIQNPFSKQCIFCRSLIHYNAATKTHHDRRRSNARGGRLLTVDDAVDIYVAQNVFAWPARHAVCDACCLLEIENVAKARYATVPTSELGQQCMQDVISIIKNSRRRLSKAHFVPCKLDSCRKPNKQTQQLCQVATSYIQRLPTIDTVDKRASYRTC